MMVRVIISAVVADLYWLVGQIWPKFDTRVLSLPLHSLTISYQCWRKSPYQYWCDLTLLKELCWVFALSGAAVVLEHIWIQAELMKGHTERQATMETHTDAYRPLRVQSFPRMGVSGLWEEAAENPLENMQTVFGVQPVTSCCGEPVLHDCISKVHASGTILFVTCVLGKNKTHWFGINWDQIMDFYAVLTLYLLLYWIRHKLFKKLIFMLK